MNPREKELNPRGREWGADFQALALPHRRFMVACGLYVGYTKTAQHSTKFTFELFFFFLFTLYFTRCFLQFATGYT